jgi:hypothetical protein
MILLIGDRWHWLQLVQIIAVSCDSDLCIYLHRPIYLFMAQLSLVYATVRHIKSTDIADSTFQSAVCGNRMRQMGVALMLLQCPCHEDSMWLYHS